MFDKIKFKFDADRLITLLFSSIFVLVTTMAIILSRYPSLREISIVTFVGGVLIGLMIFISQRATLFYGIGRWVFKKEHTFYIFIIIAVIHYIIARSLAINPLDSGWDPLTIYSGAQIISSSSSLTGFDAVYFQVFPNNLAILYFQSLLLTIINQVGLTDFTPMINVAVVTITMDIALLIMYLTTRKLFGIRASAISLVFSLVLVIGSSWSRTFYTDSIGMLFPIAYIALVVKLFESSEVKHRYILTVILGIMVTIGYTLKPTTIIVCIAGLLLLATHILSNKMPQKKLIVSIMSPKLILLLMASTLVSYVALTTSMNRYVGVEPRSMPLSNFALMGLSKVCTMDPNECRYGAWNMSDAVKSMQYKEMDDYEEYTYQEISNRLEKMGIAGYVEFLSQKATWTFGDGSFYTFKEGTEATAILGQNDTTSKTIQSVFHLNGSYYWLYKIVAQSLWILCLLALCIPITPKSPLACAVVSWSRLSIIGLLTFLLLFEARSRYVFLYLPIIIMLASYLLSNAKLPFFNRKLPINQRQQS